MYTAKAGDVTLGMQCGLLQEFPDIRDDNLSEKIFVMCVNSDGVSTQ